nr:hypothetical protein [Nocardioides caldifontis]
MLALVVLDGLGQFVELKQFAGELGEKVPSFGGCGVEELATRVDAVDASVGEALMHLGFDGDGVLGEEKRVDVEVERTEASLSSRMRSMGSRRRVMPTLIIFCRGRRCWR